MKVVLSSIMSVIWLINYSQVDSSIIISPELYNIEAINNFYNSLVKLELDSLKKVRISHIGDSHIQADFFTGTIRDHFQNYFGNAGYGFSFPYKLSKTNGSRKIIYNSNTSFSATRNIFAEDDLPVGISGYSFVSSETNTALKISMADNCNYFNTIKVFYPENNDFILANYTTSKDFNKSNPIYSTKIHTIKSGEYLSGISNKYNVSVSEIKKVNKLKSDLIYPGRTLKIPLKETRKIELLPEDFLELETTDNDGIKSFYSSNLRNDIYLFSTKKVAINGFSLENDKKGVIYNTIGVNGAKCSDYNKFPLFFKQLNQLESDLVVISSGTNESFDNLDPELFITAFLDLINNIRALNPDIEILVTTPPPSLFKRKYINTFIPLYINEIYANMKEYNYAVWDLYKALGSHESIHQNYLDKLMAKDRIHYTKKGYDYHANLLFNDLMFYYQNR